MICSHYCLVSILLVKRGELSVEAKLIDQTVYNTYLSVE